MLRATRRNTSMSSLAPSSRAVPVRLNRLTDEQVRGSSAGAHLYDLTGCLRFRGVAAL
jgi:hypothetical protein